MQYFHVFKQCLPVFGIFNRHTNADERSLHIGGCSNTILKSALKVDWEMKINTLLQPNVRVCSPAHTVYVSIYRLWEVKVDDVGHILKVNAP